MMCSEGWFFIASANPRSLSIAGVDFGNDDFRLKPASPAFKLGFKAIPVEEIGVRKE